LGTGTGLEQFQQKRDAVLRPELRKNKEIERFRDSGKSANALAWPPGKSGKRRCGKKGRRRAALAVLPLFYRLAGRAGA
jgi:hypothetical protein